MSQHRNLLVKQSVWGKSIIRDAWHNAELFVFKYYHTLKLINWVWMHPGMYICHLEVRG